MVEGGAQGPDDRLASLLADVGSFCNVRQAVLTCGTRTVARWPDADVPDAARVIAVESVGVGVDGYQLTLTDTADRGLEPAEVGALRALGSAIKRLLADDRAVERRVDAPWVQDHVALAVDYVTDSFLLLHKDWTVQHVNTQFERIAGVARTDLLGRVLWEVLPQLFGTAFEAETRAAMAGTVACVFEEFNEPLARWLQHRCFPCAEGLAILTIDTTEQKNEEQTRARIEQKLMHVQRIESLGTLAGGIAHDFNNVLAAILGHVGMLDEKLRDQPGLHDDVEQIRVAAVRAREMVQRILAFSRRGAGETAPQALRPLLEESLALLDSTLPATVELRRALAEGEGLRAAIGPSEMQQVVMNLCTNAWHAIEGGRGVIEVGLRGETADPRREVAIGELAPIRYAVITVADDGAGMNEQVLAHAFEPFFTTKPRGSGTGLGLHVVHGIVVGHGGAIDLRSRPGSGTTVSVYLPAVDATDPQEAREAPVDASTAVAGRHQRVACLDDDAVVLVMVERLLLRAGFDAVCFDQPRAFIDWLDRSERPPCDLLVTDYNMPGSNGIEVARELRRRFPDLPVIVSSGYVSDELRAAQAEGVISAIVNKERTYEDLPGVAARLLGERADPGEAGPAAA